jgi:hypothetical protein
VGKLSEMRVWCGCTSWPSSKLALPLIINISKLALVDSNEVLRLLLSTNQDLSFFRLHNHLLNSLNFYLGVSVL